MTTVEPKDVVAVKRWGHGRLRQIARRLRCRRDGHAWTGWDWIDVGVRHRSCGRRCGTHQVRPLDGVAAAVSYDQLREADGAS